MHRGDIKIETGSFIIFVGVLLSIPLFLGRAFYRALETRKRIQDEVRDLTHYSARIVGFTKKTNYSESDFLEHFAIVEYETPENEVIWAETQPCNKDMYGLNTEVDIMCRPGRARSVKIIQNANRETGFVTFEKNFEVALSLLGIGILFAVAIWYHGFAMHILGAIVAMLGVGYASGYLTKGFSNRSEKLAENQYQSICNRLVTAQENGNVPAHLTE